MRVAMLRKVFYTEQDLERKNTIQLAHNERVIGVLHSEWPNTYTVLVGEEINLPPTEAEQAARTRPSPRRWWRR